jgi:Ca2+-binding RTX toxin-like protein
MVGAATTDRNIWVMYANGTGQTPIDTNPATHDINPDWQPIPVCTQIGTAGHDVLNGTVGKDVICGRGGNDTLNGFDGSDILLGEGGNDVINGSPGNDTMNGGTGVDMTSYTGSATATSASLVTGFATGKDPTCCSRSRTCSARASPTR